MSDISCTGRSWRRRWKGTSVALVAGVGVVAAAIYATSATHAGPTQQIQARTAAVEQVDHAVQANTGSPFDVQGLIQQALQPGQSGASPADLVQQVKDVLKQFGIDPNGIQSLLDQINNDLSPQQWTQDADDFLIQQGVAAADFTELRSELIQIPSAPAQVPGWITKVLTTLDGLMAKYWIFAVAIVAVTVALIIFRTRSQPQQKGKLGPGCSTTDVLDGILTTFIKESWTARTAFVAGPRAFDPSTDFAVTFHSGTTQWYHEANLVPAVELYKRGRDILKQKGYKDSAVDLEQKMATYMRLKASGEITNDNIGTGTVNTDTLCLVINNANGPCDTCVATVPMLLLDQIRR